MQPESYSTFDNPDRNTGSARYSHVNTKDVVEEIQSITGYKIAARNGYVQARVNDSIRDGTQAHIVRFDTGKMINVDGSDIMPQLVYQGSYDTTRAIKICLGFFRIVCLNGMITGNMIAQFTQKHINFDYAALESYIRSLPEQLDRAQESIVKMRERTLTLNEQFHFANKALEIRKGSVGTIKTRWCKKHPYGTTENFGEDFLKAVLQPGRYADGKNDLWSTLNVLQEKMVKGFSYGGNRWSNRGSVPIKKITSPNENVRVNRELWNQADTYLLEKANPQLIVA